MSSDFNFYLNRSGARGLTGEKGDTGFSPIISVLSDTATEYILNIQNETTSFQTPNLRPPVAEGEGSYVRVNELGNWYIGEPSLATQEEVGMVQLSDIIDVNDDRTAVTPNLVVDYVDSHIQDLDSNLVHKTGTESISGTKTFDSRTYFIDGFTNQGADLWFRKSNSDTARIATTTDGIYVIPSSGKKFYYGTAEVATKTDVNTVQNNLNTTNTRVNSLENGITSLDSRVTSLVGRTSILEAEISTETSVRYSADSQLQSNLDAERREREIQDASLQGQLDSKLTVDNIRAGSNITLTKDGNSITISSTGGGGGSGDVTAAGNNVFTGTNTFKQIIVNDEVAPVEASWVNNKVVLKYNYDRVPYLDRTFAGANDVIIDGSPVHFDFDPTNVKSYLLHQYSVEGSETIEVTQTDKGIQLSANLDEIGGEVNALANRVSTNETAIESLDDRVTDLEESGSGVAKFPNATIFGEPTIQAGQVSNLFNGNYLQFPFALEHKGRAWECNLCFTTHLNDVSTQQNIIDSRCSIALAVRNKYLVLALSSNGTTFDIGEFTMGQLQISPQTTYYVKITYQPTVGYTIKADTKEIDDSSPTYVIGRPNTPIASTLMTISSPTQPFYGSVNLNNWDLYVEDLLVWQGMDDVGLSTRLDTNLSNVSEIGKQTIKDIVGSTGTEYIDGEGIIIKDGMETIQFIDGSNIQRFKTGTWGGIDFDSPLEMGTLEAVGNVGYKMRVYSGYKFASVDSSSDFTFVYTINAQYAYPNTRLLLSSTNTTTNFNDPPLSSNYKYASQMTYNQMTIGSSLSANNLYQSRIRYVASTRELFLAHRVTNSATYEIQANIDWGEWEEIRLNDVSQFTDIDSYIDSIDGIYLDNYRQNSGLRIGENITYLIKGSESAPKSINADKQFIENLIDTKIGDIGIILDNINGEDIE